MRKLKCIMLLTSLLYLSQATSSEQNLIRVSIADIPKAKSSLIKLITAMAKNTNQQIHIDTFPFARSIRNVTHGNFDVHLPLIKPVKNIDKLEYAFSEQILFYVSFSLYTNKIKDFPIEDISKYEIITDAGHTDLFNFKIEKTSNLQASLNQLSNTRIDGIIFSSYEMDNLIKKSNLRNIIKKEFRVYPVHAVIKKNQRNNFVDKWIKKGMEKIIKNKEYNNVFNSHLKLTKDGYFKL